MADIYYSGIILTGGGALLKGVKERLGTELNLQVTMPEDPTTTVAVGAGALFGRTRKTAPVCNQAEPPGVASGRRAFSLPGKS